jgi:predicted nucleic acid-binding protein
VIFGRERSDARPGHVILARWYDLADSDKVIICTPVTVAELWHGARPPEYRALEALFESILCVPIDKAIGRRAGEFLQKYRKSHSLELGDALIAATASVNNADLWTRNHKHFPMWGVHFF